MSEEAQEAEASVVDTTPVPNEAEQDEQVEKPEAEETDEQSPEAESEKTVEERLAELEEDNKSKKQTIDRKTAAYHDLQRAYDKRQQEIQALQAKVQAEEPLKEPAIDDFETHEDYLKARDEYVEKRAEQKAFDKFQQDQLQRQAAALTQERNEIRGKQESEFIADNPDYLQSKAEFESYIKTSNVAPETEKAIVDQAFRGNIAQLIDYFGRNSGENIPKLHEISQMTAVEAAVEVFKIQQSLTAPAPKEDKPPPKPVNKPKGKGAVKKSLEKMDGSDVLKWVSG